MKAVDFFCGAGGVTRGFLDCGIRVLAGIDIDASCRKTYQENNNVPFLNWDISKVAPADLKNEINVNRNDDDVIFVGCSPCQYYSNIKTDKTRSMKTRYLLDDFSDFVEYYQPGYVFVENVPGFEKNKKSPIKRFMGILSSLGYHYDDKVINAKYFGVPQSRRRYILIATRLNNELTIPSEDKGSIMTVRDAIGNMMKFKNIKAGTIDETVFQHTAASLSPKNLERIMVTSKNGGDRRCWQHIKKLQLPCYQKHNGHYDVYSRMFWDRPAPTITTRFRSISNGRYGHPEQDRAISIREGATLQSFPMDYVFYSNSVDHIGKMIGNAVPPKVAEKIGMEIIKNFRSTFEK
ncbi:MAG: DNA cytosine methyltransferase [Spirochaetes bacterium]|nr:DNA cytosine methyltransferase [Spirochaetota bacterium]